MPRKSQGPQLRANAKKGGTFYIYWSERRGARSISRERSTSTRDRAEAHQRFSEWLAAGGDAPERIQWDGPRRAAQATVADVMNLYIDGHAADHTASPETILFSMQALLTFWGGQTCDAIRPETCRAYVKARVGHGIKEATAARELSTLRAALGYAFKNGKLIDRPFVELPQRPPGRDRWLTRSEVAALLWQSRKTPHARGHLPLFILLALATGARPSALYDLQWNQIDFTHNRIDFNPPGRKQTSKRRPIVPIPRRLRWFLLRAHARATSPHVLTYAGRPIRHVKASFKAARMRAGLGSEVVPYTLRHTCGTHLAQAGVPLWQIAGWLGHTTEKTTQLYSHHHPDHMQAARKVMD